MSDTLDPRSPGAMRYAWYAVLLLAVLWLGWQALAANLADHYLPRAEGGDSAALAAALWWRPGHPRALTLRGRELLREGKPQEARALLQRAVRGNPADARPLLDLAALYTEAGNPARADRLVETAHALAPVDPALQRNIGIYWLQRGDAARGIAHIATALSGDGSLREPFFPVLLAAAEDPALREALRPLTLDPPAWWAAFIHFASRTAASADSVMALLQMRAAATDAPPGDSEREPLLQRLHRDGRVADAYLLWVNGLDERALAHLGYVFDGGFELPPANSGFGWYAVVPRNGAFRIATGATHGMAGERALYIGFSGKRAPFGHVYQNLFLGPGRYEVSGQVRPEDLRARRGLQWRVQCIAGGTQLLGESELFEGRDTWRRFAFDIEVPEGCAGQILRLHSAGNREVDHEVQGSIWFDALRIARKPEPEPASPHSGEPAQSPAESVVSDGAGG